MATTSSPKRKRLLRKLVRPLISAGLLTGGLFHMVEPAFALGTLANTQINNQATATYQSGTNTLNAVSNTVSVVVSPIAGVTVVNDKIVDLDGNAVEAGDVVSYYFTVTNVGNFNNVIRIPTAVDVTNLDANGDGTPDTTIDVTGTTYLSHGVVILYDQAGDGLNFTDNAGGTAGVWDPGETGPDVWVYTTNAGGTGQDDYYNGTNLWDNASVLIPPDTSFTVVVTGQAPTDGTVGAGDPLTVTLGDTTTSPPDNSAGQQNVAYVADTTGDNDVFTVNDFNNDGTENDADFVNGQKEAGATQTIPYAASVNPLAIAAVKKSGVYTANNVSTYADDTIDYTLNLEVRDTDPTNLFQPASLAGIQINLDGATANRIIVSDLLPVDAAGNPSVLQSVSSNLPSGWTAVYSTDDATTVGNEAPTTARWWTSFGGGAGQPANLAAVKRVGFVYDNGALSAGYNTATVAGSLTFTVVLSNSNTAATPSLAVYNVAQVVGITQGDNPATPTNPIYDESGDNRANNYSDDGTAPNPDGSDYDPTTDTGVPANEDTNGTAGLQNDELDTSNNNTGTDSDPSVGGGEPNLITAIRTVQDNILIGPNGQPAAVGPDGSQDTDFTNATQSFTPADANSDGIFDDFDPAEIVFTNTIQNPNTTGFIANVTVEPADITLVNATTGAGVSGDIPNGTVVRLTFGGTTVYYGYDSATGLWSGPFTNANLTGATTPLVVDTSLVAGESQTVTVGVNLPNITNITYNTLPSYPINLVVFPDENVGATPGYTGETTYNLTINRLYPAGFIELVKSARIYTYDETNGTVNPTPTAYSDAPDAYPAATSGNIRPGDVIEYRVIYTNISEPASGFGNVTLTGETFKLTEDGTTAVNNWATWTLHQLGTNTGAVAGDPPYRGTVTYDGAATEPGDDAAVEVYENTVTSVAPGISGTFTFKRQVQ